MKAIEGKIVVLGAQGKNHFFLFLFRSHKSEFRKDFVEMQPKTILQFVFHRHVNVYTVV